MSAIRARMFEELGYDPYQAPTDGWRVAPRPQLCDVDRPTDRLAVGAMVAARDGLRAVAVARLQSGRLVVVDDACPHDGGLISDGFVEGELLVCARHNREFTVGQDEVLGPCRRVCKPRE